MGGDDRWWIGEDRELQSKPKNESDISKMAAILRFTKFIENDCSL